MFHSLSIIGLLFPRNDTSLRLLWDKIEGERPIREWKGETNMAVYIKVRENTSHERPRRRRGDGGNASPEDYLIDLPAGAGRDRLIQLRQLLFECAFDFEESLEDERLVYRKDGESVFRLFLTQGYVWFTMRRAIDPVWPRRLGLAHLMTKRQTLRIGTDELVLEGALRSFVRESVGTWRDHRNEERVQL